MQCSIVIRTFNEAKYLRFLLDGIKKQHIVADIETIVVDSGSTDGTVEIATQYGAKVINILPSEFSFGRSLNRGIRAASHEYILIASAHVFPVYPNWIEQLVAPLANPSTALSYGKQRGTDARFISAGIPNTTKFSEREIFMRWFPEKANPSQDQPFCNNANAAIRRSLWLMQPYDETLTGLEDLAWAKWALEQGYTLAYVPEAEVIHIHNETPLGVRNRYKREAMAFKNIYPEAHFNIYDFLRMFFSNIANDIGHATHQGILFANIGSILWFRFNQFWGTYLGYREAVVWNWQLRQTYYYPRGTTPESATVHEVEPIRYDQPG